MGEVVVDGVSPIRVQHTRQFQEATTDVGRVSGIAVSGVDAIELAVVSLQATAEFEAEFFIGGGDFEAALGFDYDIGAVSGDGASESLGGYCHGQCAGGKNRRSAYGSSKSSPNWWSVAWKHAGLARLCWEGILEAGYFSRVADR